MDLLYVFVFVITKIMAFYKLTFLSKAICYMGVVVINYVYQVQFAVAKYALLVVLVIAKFIL